MSKITALPSVWLSFQGWLPSQPPGADGDVGAQRPLWQLASVTQVQPRPYPPTLSVHVLPRPKGRAVDAGIGADLGQAPGRGVVLASW